MGTKNLIEAVRLCGSTPKVDQCRQCDYWAGGDMSKCIPRMTSDAAETMSALQAENIKLRGELEQFKHSLAMMWFAYVNCDKEFPHSYGTEALADAERLLGPWAECMPKYLPTKKEDAKCSSNL